MPTRNVNLTDELDRFVSVKVGSGLYANASEVIRAARRMLEHEDRENEAKIAALRTAIEAGLASGVAEPGVFDHIRSKHGLTKRTA